MSRTLSAKQVLSVKHPTIELGGIWDDCVGPIGRTGVVFFWGNSGNGKTSAVVSFCKALCAHGKVLYISKEEGFGLTMQNTLRRYGIADCGNRFQLDDTLTLDELDKRLDKQRSADFVVVDSFQYMQISYKEYRDFVGKHQNKLIIFVSQADGKRPAGRTATRVMYDSALKLWVEGYKVFSKGRYMGATGECTIWPEGASVYWDGKHNNFNTNDK